MNRALHRLMWLALASVCACGRDADAQFEDEDTDAADEEPDSDEAFGADAPPAQPELDAPTAEAEIDAAIAAARAHAQEEELALAREKNEIDALARELDARLAGIDKLEQRLDELVGAGKIAQERRRERIDVLATLLATMPPQAAATMLAQMSEVEAQELVLAVAQSDKRKAAKLIATMPAGRAAAIGQDYLRRDPKALGSEAVPAATSPNSAPIPSTPTSSSPPATDEPQEDRP
jgi:flagellar motility protein MotE (MotC chaperone)